MRPHSCCTTDLILTCEIRQKGSEIDYIGRRQAARAAHRRGPKDGKSVGGGLSVQLVLISSVCSVWLCGARFTVFEIDPESPVDLLRGVELRRHVGI